MKNNNKKFVITGNKGFQMRLANGYVVSIQFGPMNYCENRDFFRTEAAPNENGLYECDNAETGVFHAQTGEWAIPPWDQSDQVQGWQSPEDIVKLIAWASSLPSPYAVKKEGEVDM